jgi:hypothetical protein
MFAIRRRAIRLFTIIFCLSTAGLSVAPSRSAHADVTQDPPEKLLTMMIEATKNRSFADFMVEANDEMRMDLTQQNFEGVCGQVSSRLQKGYKTKYLTKLRKEDQMVVYLWKLEYADGKDDSLITMAVKNKKVAGILLQ